MTDIDGAIVSCGPLVVCARVVVWADISTLEVLLVLFDGSEARVLLRRLLQRMHSLRMELLACRKCAGRGPGVVNVFGEAL